MLRLSQNSKTKKKINDSIFPINFLHLFVTRSQISTVTPSGINVLCNCFEQYVIKKKKPKKMKKYMAREVMSLVKGRVYRFS